MQKSGFSHTRSGTMHIPDGFIDLRTAAVAAALAGVGIAIALRDVRAPVAAEARAADWPGRGIRLCRADAELSGGRRDVRAPDRRRAGVRSARARSRRDRDDDRPRAAVPDVCRRRRDCARRQRAQHGRDRADRGLHRLHRFAAQRSRRSAVSAALRRASPRGARHSPLRLHARSNSRPPEPRRGTWHCPPWAECTC